MNIRIPARCARRSLAAGIGAAVMLALLLSGGRAAGPGEGARV